MRNNQQKTDLLILARRCHDLGPGVRPCGALAIANGTIVATGTRRSILRLRSRGTRVLDLGEAAVTPGLVDCHTHFVYWALGRALVIDLSPLRSLNDVLQKIHKSSARKRVGEWVMARGYDYNRWSDKPPCAVDLDRAVADHPAMAYSRDGHSVWLNTRAMRKLRIDRRTPDPEGGRYLRDTRGRPTGIVQETALYDLPDPLREFALRTDAPAIRTVGRALDAGYRAAWRLGIVGVHVMDDAPSLLHLQRHHADDHLGLRIMHAIQLADLDHALALGLRSGLGDTWLRLGGVKIFSDGALGSQTAYMFDPYPGKGDYHGVPVTAGEELKESVCRAARHGWASWVHAIGDRAVHETIDAIVAAQRVATTPLPHRIEHVQCIRPRDIRRMSRAGIIASVQPCHLLGDIDTANRHWPRARRNTYPFRRLLDASVTLASGSDLPIESIDPRRSLFAATMRTTEQGQPPEGWFPQQRISTEEALRAFTRGAAVASGGSAAAGTLRPGAPADLTIWAEDPVRAAPESLLDIGVVGCVIHGQVHLTEHAS